MDKETGKPWERPWTTDEIREHSSNWNLAGDSGLLHHLQQFSQNLLTKTHATEVALDKLTEDLKATSNSVQNATNTFLFLANTQFVENRVYDDDEKETPPEEKKDVNPPKSKEEQEAEVFQNVKKALDMGLALLDTHFETVEVPASDSEEEESSASVGRLVLKPKNPYISRPLPYLIGSKEFMEDDRVGLGELSSDTEESPDQNVAQSSGSDDEMEHDELLISSKRPVALSSSEAENSESESDRSGTVVKQKKLRTSSLMAAIDDEEDEGNMFGRESTPPEADEVEGIMKNAFSDELSTKLASTKPQTSLKKETENDNMFVPSSELDDDDTGLFGRPRRSFTERQGLFDDLDDWKSTSDSLWNDNNSSIKPSTDSVKKDPQSQKIVNTSHNSEILTGNQDEDIFSTPKQKQYIQTNTVQEGKIKESTPKSFLSSEAEGALFGQNDESDDLFSEKPKVTGAATSNATLFGKDELEEDDLFAIPTSTVDSKSGASQNEVKKKKPPGAVRVFSDLGLFDNSSPVRRNSGEEKNAAERKVGSDDSVLHQDHSSGIDGGSSDQAPQKEGWERERKSSEISSLNDSKLFQGRISSTKTSDLEANNSPLFKTEVDGGSLFDKQRFSEPGTLDQNIFGSRTSATTSSAPSNLKPKLKKPVSLFDESDSGDDELLFSSTSSTSSRSRRSQGSGDFLGSSVERRILPKKGLFEDNLLFGTGTKDEPEVDIFTSQSESKAKGDSLAQDNSFSGNGASCDTSISSKKTVSNIFDDIDEVDDIFAVPKITVENTQSRSVKNADTGLGKFSLFSDDSGEVNDIFSSKIIENEKNDGFMSGQEQSQSVVPDIYSVTNNRGAESSLVGEDSLPLPSGIENEVENETKVRKNTKPTISQKPKVPTKPAPSLLSSQGYPNSMQSSFPPQIESNIESSTNISVNDTKFEVTEKLSNVTTNNQGQKSSNNIGGEKVSESVTPVPSVKPEPPRTLNIRKTTDIVFENPSNDDDLFESWSKKSSMGTDNVIKEQPTRKVLSNVLDSYGSNATSSVSRDNSSLDFSRKHVPTVGISPSDIAESQKTALSPSKLYIDPRTLLPGAKPPSLSVATDGAVGFDRPAETASMLHSAGKERVKIQVKRRPQTRKARQEALRASSIEYDSIDAALISQISNSKTDSVQNNVVSSSASNSSPVKASAPKVFEPNRERKSPTAEKSVISVSKASPKNSSEDHSSVSESEQLLPKTDALKNIVSDCLSGNSNALSPLTDEEDLFAVPHELPFDDSSNKEMPNDDKNLFGGAPVISPLGEKTGSDSFSSQSALNIEREQDVSLPGKETSDLQETLERAKNNGNPIAGPIGSEISGSSPLVDKPSRNISSISDTEDIFTELPNSKWLVQDDVGANEKRGLFDDEKGNDEERDDDDDDDDDDDLFLSVKKRGKIGKKSGKDVSTEAASWKSPLFLPDFDNALGNTTKDNKERKQSSSEELVPASMEDKVSLQKDSDILFPPVKSVNKSVSSNHKENIGSSELFFQSISDSSQTVESGDLFASNISTEDVRTDSAAKITHKVVASVSQGKTKSRVESLFGDDSIESDDLFGSSSVPKMPGSGSTRNFITGSKTKDTKGLFDDGDDDDIFTLGLNKSKGPKSETLFSKEDGSQSTGKEADDLFSKRNMNSKNQGAKHSSTQKVQSFEDPLMGFNK